MDLPMFYNSADEWQRMMFLYNAAVKEVNTKLEIINNEYKMTKQYNPIEHLTSRIKSIQSIEKKMKRYGKDLTVPNIVKYINDMAGIRIICSFTSDIYRIADILKNQSDIRVLKIKDYIAQPKPNGYSSYHMLVAVPIFLTNEKIETKVEIQIRTIAMDFWASLEHKIYYKHEGYATEKIRKELADCAEIVAYLDKRMMAINDELKEMNKDLLGNYTEVRKTQDEREDYSVIFDSM